MADMQVDVVSAEAQLYSGRAEMVLARSTEGELGILPGHQPLLIALGDAPVRIKATDGQTVVVDVHHGFLEFSDNQCTVLADSAEFSSEA